MDWHVLLVHLFLILGIVTSQDADPCAAAPNEAAKIMCKQLHKWDDSARKESTKKKIALPPGFEGMLGKSVAAEFAPIASSIYQCMDLTCMCNYLRGTSAPNGECTLPSKQKLTKAKRKEYRMMTDDERNRYHNALKALKQNGEYDRIARIHAQIGDSGGAHSGPAFLAWHREFIKRYEFAIRQVDPGLHLPYWDSTLDQALPSPKDSVIFTADMAGDTDAAGNVISGPFANWRTLEGRANILRKVGAQAQLLDQSHIDFVMKQTLVDQVMAFTAPKQGCPYRTDFNCLEYSHGNVHIFVGGDMFDTSTSANDPLFFMHHCFIDFIWEMWRLARQTRADRELQFPPDNQLCSNPQHFGAAGLLPFTPLRNVDGLSNKFTDNLYDYAPRPTCSQATKECGSKFLFCDLSHGAPHCAAKMRSGANCGMYTQGENPCYNGLCQGGRCMAGANIVTQPPVVVTTPPPVVVIAPQETCFNENQCCAAWALKGECTRNVQYMNEWCKASCGKCKPQYPLIDDCSDRHVNCATWGKSGECTKNVLWMSENCRKSCSKCAQTRAQACGGAGGNTAVTTTVKPLPACENSEGCYNENVCCPHWGLRGECRKSSPWMACNCRVSCGHCIPQDYNYGSCVDYHKSCAGWARLGECEKNPWMSENCRASCKTCYSQNDLRNMCQGAAGSVAPVATNRQTTGQWGGGTGNWNGGRTSSGGGSQWDQGGGGWNNNGNNGGNWGGNNGWGRQGWGNGGWGGGGWGGGGWGGGGWGGNRAKRD